MSRENPHHPSLRPLFDAYETIASKQSYAEFDAMVYAQLDKSDLEPELDFFFEHALQLAAYLGSNPTEFLCDGAARACEELAKEAVITYLHSHPQTTVKTKTVSIRSTRDHRIAVKSSVGIPSVSKIPEPIWVDLFRSIAPQLAAA